MYAKKVTNILCGHFGSTGLLLKYKYPDSFINHTLPALAKIHDIEHIENFNGYIMRGT